MTVAVAVTSPNKKSNSLLQQQMKLELFFIPIKNLNGKNSKTNHSKCEFDINSFIIPFREDESHTTKTGGLGVNFENNL